MVKVLFICHGNICRSPMAEYLLRDMVRRQGLAAQFQIASAATSREEIGNDVYPPARAELRAHGAPSVTAPPCRSRRATTMITTGC